MISTVTTSTVTLIEAMGLAAITGGAATVALIALLIARELASASLSPSSQLIARFLNVGILPLIVVFAVTVAVKIAEILA
ncbi:hypothetical protein M1N59_00915 [Dehalococcoidales bacterium]|nr:hypothetical protein [Dehalococcoidales bacterium]